IVLLAVSLAASGAVQAEQLFPFILGINIGAALPAITATLSESVEVRRIPLGNLLFRITGVAIAVPLTRYATEYIGQITTDPGFSIIVFHLMFNAALLVIFIAFTQLVAKLTETILPASPVAESEIIGPKYLDHKLYQTPPAAISAATRETLRIGDSVRLMLVKTKQVLDDEIKAKQQNIGDDEDLVDKLNNEIKLYLAKLMAQDLDEEDSKRAIDIISFTPNLEHVGDIIERGLFGLANKKQRLGVSFSKEGQQEIDAMYERVLDTLDLAMNTFLSGHIDSARELIARKTGTYRTFKYTLMKYAEIQPRLDQKNRSCVKPCSIEVRLVSKINFYV
ncbi:MAG: hypothetical protein L3J12_06105, partial [Spirochaetales bacterium]|nr:hypothetical protein [Spirochaetales bacterium]